MADQAVITAQYQLTCLVTGARFADGGVLGDMPLENPKATQRGFLRTEYAKRRLDPGNESDGLYRFSDWLPLRRRLAGSSAPMSYRSEGLAEQLGLTNLIITFSGYWPERNARMLSGTFKECEAYSVCGRMPPEYGKTLVVASAGNTARAFMRVCSDNAISLVVVVPEQNLNAIWTVGTLGPSVVLIAAAGDSDYLDAIRLADRIADRPGFIAEGGAKNVARRDGMGTTVLSAATFAGKIPDYYFQAVGSGTGAIAAWEAAERLSADGRFGDNKMRLMLVQNEPFVPMRTAWSARSRELPPMDAKDAKDQIAEMYAKVLSNRRPPYSLVGGLFDALTAEGGEILAVDNDASRSAGRLFYETEGIDITPAASVAVAGLIRSVEEKRIEKDAAIMLNVTGGGINRVFRDFDIVPGKPEVVVDPDASEGELDAVLSQRRL
ncbi:MAG: cysteate synthase [Spirochaetaceae bacterium]